MNDIEFGKYILGIIKRFDTPQEALTVISQTPAPNRLKRGKKALCKVIRTYIYLMNN